MKVELAPEEINAIVSGLSMSANFIETGNPIMTSVDVEKSGRGKLRALTTDQMESIVMLRRLCDRLLNIEREIR